MCLALGLASICGMGSHANVNTVPWAKIPKKVIVEWRSVVRANWQKSCFAYRSNPESVRTLVLECRLERITVKRLESHFTGYTTQQCRMLDKVESSRQWSQSHAPQGKQVTAIEGEVKKSAEIK